MPPPLAAGEQTAAAGMSKLKEMCSGVFKKCCGGSKNQEIDDSNVDAVIARNLWKNHRILPPTSPFKQNWDLVMLLLVFYNCVYIPIELFFLNGIVTHGDYPKALAHRVIDYFVDILFFIDILLNTCTVR